MEYKKIMNMLDITSNEPSKFKAKNWIEINVESRGTYNEDNQIRFKTSMLRSNLIKSSDAYILVKWTITVRSTAAQGQTNNARNKLFTNCMSRINNTQVDDDHDIDAVMPMYALIEYSDNYSKAPVILWKYCKDELALATNAIDDLNIANTITDSFKIKEKLTGETGDDAKKSWNITIKKSQSFFEKSWNAFN